MVQVDLITGFLGAGKTTFIHKYIAYLSRRGQKIRVIENEFGSIGVDRTLLLDDDCDISDLTGVCMCCKGKDLFKKMLIQSAVQGYDRILVEPSGIYDVDEFFAVMSAEEVREHCRIGSILTIVDGQMDEGLTEEAKYLMFSQLLAAGTVIMSKTQLFPEAVLGKTIGQLNLLLAQYGSPQPLGDDLCTKNWDDFTDEDFAAFQQSGFRILEHQRNTIEHDIIFHVKETADYCENIRDLEVRLRNLFSCADFGRVLRVKGHIQDLDKNWYEVNCAKDAFSIRPCKIKRGLLVIIGQELNEPALRQAFIPRKI